MKQYINIKQFHQPLMDAGLVPKGCRLLDIRIGVNGALAVKFEVFWTAEDLKAFGIICQDIAEKAMP